MVILYTAKNGEYTSLEGQSNIKDNVYVNLTNRCPAACTFCLRNTKEMAESNSLWLKREPTREEVISEFDKYDLSKCNEIIFCGFGEPMERVYDIVEIASYIKNKYKDMHIRMNTNGLANLVHGKDITPLLKDCIDTVSISLNASNAEEYYKITRNKFGIGSYDEMLKFAVECKKYVPNVVMTVVDCIGEEEIEACRKVCEKIGLPLRVRPFEE